MPQVLFLLAVAVGGYILARRLLNAAPNPMRDPQTRDGASERNAVEDMRPCPVCGTFRPDSMTTGCERSQCPYPQDGAG